MNKSITTKEDAFQALNDPVVRRGVVKQDFFLFFTVYFPHHMKYVFAQMHKDMIAMCQDENVLLALVMAFRGSGKSTIITTAFPLWAILGKLQKKYVVIVAKTKPQAKQMMKNIKAELELNPELRKDLGPFQEETDEWGSEAISFSHLGARIVVVSVEQSLKGLRHRQYRPDIIILDDVEDNESVKTKEMRDKTYDKYKRDILPLGDLGTKIIHVGNMLHDNSLMMRLSREMESGDRTKEFKRYPIVDEEGNPNWLGKFPTKEDVEKECLKIHDEVAWALEYQLVPISGSEQIIKNEEIQYYNELPKRIPDRYGDLSPRYIVVGVDLAISQSDSADYTAIVPILYQKNPITGQWEGYVLKDFVHKRLDFNETNDVIIALNKSLRVYGDQILFAVETVAYQQALVQSVRMKCKDHITLVEKNTSLSKESRLRVAKPMFSNKGIFFPRDGAEAIVTEITGFGKERHDDLVDAVTLSINHAMESVMNRATVICV